MRRLLPALALCCALLPAAAATAAVPGLSQTDGSAIVGLANAHWPQLGCDHIGVRVVRGPGAAAAVDRSRRCAIVLNVRVRRTAMGWCRAMKPVFARLAAGTRTSAVPYDCGHAVGPLPKRAKYVTPPGIGAADARRAYAVASAHWPGSPCRGREQVRMAPYAQLMAQSADPVDAATVIMGQAVLRDPRCVVLLNASWRPWTPAVLCLVVEHEFGHLKGLRHAPSGVMAAVDAHSPDCEAAFGSAEGDAAPVPTPAAPELPVTVSSGGFGGLGG